MPDISSALVLLRKPIDAVGEAATDKAKEIFVRLRANSTIRTLYQKLNSTQKVKSIWNVDRAIAISSFYFPAKIKVKGGFSQQLTAPDELPSNHVVLSGIVGQGKSILLRYLLGKEMRSGKRVPIFIELRRVAQANLETYITRAFNDLVETWSDPQLFHYFAKEGKVSLFLDGFDEVDPARAQEVGTEIDSLAAKYPTIRIIVTSRPGSGIETSPLFDVIALAPLQHFDLPAFFQRILSKDKALADRITAAVKGSQAVSALASTPLLATLLTIVYRAHQRIPTDFPEFYEELFQILLVRHDRSKSGYERRRKVKLGDREIQQVFEAFCYKTKADGTSSLSRGRASELAAASVLAQQLSCDSEAFLEDILKITCLLQEEGGRIEFLHQSVQEFFAARYIASRPDEVAKKFYQLTLEHGKWQHWDQVLKFLQQVDQYRASKYFYIPMLSESLARLESIDENASDARLRQLISDRIGVRQSLAKSTTGQLAQKFFIHFLDDSLAFRTDAIHSRIFNKFFGAENVAGTAWQACFDKVTEGQLKSYTEIAEHCGIGGVLNQTLGDAVNALRSELTTHRTRVSNFNSSSEFMGL